MSRTVSICALSDLAVGLGRAYRVGDRTIAVFRSRSGRVFAVDNVCPHKAGPLAEGMLIGEQVVCPMHTYRFHGVSGACDQPNTCAIGTYPIEVVDGNVILTLPSD